MAKTPQIFRYNLQRYKYIFLAVRKADSERVEAVVACKDSFTALTLSRKESPSAADIGLTVQPISFTAAREAFTVGGCFRLYVWSVEGRESRLCDPSPNGKGLARQWFEVVEEGRGADILQPICMDFSRYSEPPSFEA